MQVIVAAIFFAENEGREQCAVKFLDMPAAASVTTEMLALVRHEARFC